MTRLNYNQPLFCNSETNEDSCWHRWTILMQTFLILPRPVLMLCTFSSEFICGTYSQVSFNRIGFLWCRSLFLLLLESSLHTKRKGFPPLSIWLICNLPQWWVCRALSVCVHLNEAQKAGTWMCCLYLCHFCNSYFFLSEALGERKKCLMCWCLGDVPYIHMWKTWEYVRQSTFV